MTVQELLDLLANVPRDIPVLMHQYYMDGTRKSLGYAKLKAVRLGSADSMELENMDWDISVPDTGKNALVIALDT